MEWLTAKICGFTSILCFHSFIDVSRSIWKPGDYFWVQWSGNVKPLGNNGKSYRNEPHVIFFNPDSRSIGCFATAKLKIGKFAFFYIRPIILLALRWIFRNVLTTFFTQRLIFLHLLWKFYSLLAKIIMLSWGTETN